MCSAQVDQVTFLSGFLYMTGDTSPLAGCNLCK